MAVQDKSCASSSNTTVHMDDRRICLDVGSQSGNAVQFKENHSSGEENVPKVRKPYTITKQRERWTEEEHEIFLEALRLYGRAWRRIEEHIGTKTAVQIRSHAQKFFSKVVRESNSNDAGIVKPIDIPPPRPKRKPMHPYPRKIVPSIKRGTSVSEKPEWSTSPNIFTSEQDNRSPASVSSDVGSDTVGSSFSNPESGCQSAVSSVSGTKPDISLHTKQENSYQSTSSLAEEENRSSCGSVKDQSSVTYDFCSKGGASEEGVAVEAPIVSLKLFGTTVLVTDSHRPSSSSSIEVCKSPAMQIQQENSDTKDGKTFEASQSNTAQSNFVGSNSSIWSRWPSIMCNLQYEKLNSTAKEAAYFADSSPCLWASYGGLPFPVTSSINSNSIGMTSNSSPKVALEERNIQVDGKTGTTSNTISINQVEMAHKTVDFVKSQRRETYSDSGEKEVDLLLLLKPRETLESLNQKSDFEKRKKGFVPYKRCLAESDKHSSRIAGEERDGQRMRLCL